MSGAWLNSNFLKYVGLGILATLLLCCIYLKTVDRSFPSTLTRKPLFTDGAKQGDRFKTTPWLNSTAKRPPLKSYLARHPSLLLPRGNLSSFELPPNAGDLQVEETFIRVSNTAEIACPRSSRIGNRGDGGWDVCEYGNFLPKKPCLVYSFGINNDWSFDDGVVKTYGCMVRSFDPSMNMMDQKRNPLNVFFKEGLSGRDVVLDNLWRVNTLKTIKEIFMDKVIDYLKFDIEGYEWESLNTSIRDGSLLNVKQIAFEIHSEEAHFRTTPIPKLKVYLNILSGLRELGFYRWYAHTNPLAPKINSSRSGKFVWCCHEIVYLNLNFL